jgi:hypothetical protein
VLPGYTFETYVPQGYTNTMMWGKEP